MTRRLPLAIGYRFYPVGQGLFSCGSLQLKDRNEHGFRWVYDCGTTSSQSLIEWAIERLRSSSIRRSSAGQPGLDLAVISHFDKDHISGFVPLLKTFSIDTLLLPYMPLWQRLLLAFTEGVDTQQRWMQFFIDPAGFLSGIPGGNIGRIVFVPPSGGESAGAIEIAETAPPDDGEQDFHWELKTTPGHPRADDRTDWEMLTASAESRGVAVEFQRPGSALVASGLWEFLPYNDADLAPKATPAFRKAVDQRRGALIGADGKEKRRSALVALRDLYDRQFGKTSHLRNAISLMLYSGPIVMYYPEDWPYPRWDFGPHILKYRKKGAGVSTFSYRMGSPLPRSISTLHTGDAFLDTKKRSSQMIQFLRESRIESLGCLQVMHHGARGNWHPGLAEKLSPQVSVFCADPKHRGFEHPHGEVVRDFLPYMPVQVDDKTGISIWNHVWVRVKNESM